MNAVERNGAGTPVRLTPDDFEVFRTELSTQASTVVMLDMSRVDDQQRLLPAGQEGGAWPSQPAWRESWKPWCMLGRCSHSVHASPRQVLGL